MMKLGGKKTVFAPKQGDISQRVCLGFRQEIPASDSLRLIMDGSNYLFIHLSSSLFSFPLSACSASKSKNEGNSEGPAAAPFKMVEGSKPEGPCYFHVQSDVVPQTVDSHRQGGGFLKPVCYCLVLARRLGAQVFTVTAVL